MDNNVKPSLSTSKAIELLKKQYKKGRLLLNKRPLKNEQYKTWENTTRDILVKAFGINSINISAVMEIGKHGDFPVSATERYLEEHRANSLDKQLVAIDGLVELLHTELEIKSDSKNSLVKSETVFLVHGQSHGVKESVARFLEKLDLKVIILHEQPNVGRTIIEKFVEYSDVGFAVVLLTGDDRGGKTDLPFDKQSLRARQNVVLELGYFLGKLGRKRVCALYQDGVEIPSDYQGVLFLELDESNSWRLQLAKELKAAGLPIDMNKAM